MSLINDICEKHKKQFSVICLNSLCNYFNSLCSDCLLTHNHPKTQEPQPKYMEFITLKEKISPCLNKAKETIKELASEMTECLNDNPNSKLDVIFAQINYIKEEVCNIFDEFKDEIKTGLKNKVKKIDEEIFEMYDELKISLNFCEKKVFLLI